ncbi:MAG: 1-acyl-sn-glycerol-3-phosphate acyltransferase [Bacteroidetes bacterium]|nr:MAG: 1-acyl-sn-glycerol-3-phosphate acyltransferase [Bacteroidota bacterium]
MKFVWMIPRILWKLWFVLNFLITLLLLYPVFLVLLSRESRFGAAFHLIRFWAKWLCYGAGLFPVVKYEIDINNIPEPCIFISNHSSYIDIILSYVVVPNFFIFVGKQELDKAPLFRLFFKRMHILVNRKSNVDSHRAYLRSGEKIDKGQSVFIFPEATISSSGTLIPFKNGAFKLAIDKQVPVVPIVFFDNWKHLQSGGFLTSNGRPGILRARMLNAVGTKGLTNADLIPLREKVKSIIQETLEKGIGK